MDIDTAAKEFHKKNITEAMIEPSPNGNGWRVLFHHQDGSVLPLTDHTGSEKIYHTLDKATETIRSEGISNFRVEEHF